MAAASRALLHYKSSLPIMQDSSNACTNVPLRGEAMPRIVFVSGCEQEALLTLPFKYNMSSKSLLGQLCDVRHAWF